MDWNSDWLEHLKIGIDKVWSTQIIEMIEMREIMHQTFSH